MTEPVNRGPRWFDVEFVIVGAAATLMMGYVVWTFGAALFAASWLVGLTFALVVGSTLGIVIRDWVLQEFSSVTKVVLGVWLVVFVVVLVWINVQ